MKKVLTVALAVVMSLSLVLLSGCGGDSEGGSAASGESKTLSLGYTGGETSTWNSCAEEFKQIVEEKTEGRYTINLYPSDQLSNGDTAKGVEQVVSGQTDLDMHSAMIYSTLDEKFLVCMMPFLFENGYDDIDKYIFNGEGGEKIMDLAESAGVHPIALAENGFRQLTNSKTAVHSPADMKGLKVRIPSNNMYVSLYKAMGADPTAMSFSEVFTALQQGTIDGQENPIDIIDSAKLSEVQKYLTIWNYSYDPIIFAASNKCWESLSDEDKAIFEEAAKEACANQVTAIREAEEEQLKGLEEAMEVNTLTADEVAAFKEVAAPIYDEYVEKLGADLFAAFGYEK